MRTAGPQTLKKRKAISDELDEACQEYAFIGSQHPDTHRFIEARYELAKLNLKVLNGAPKK